MAVGNDRIDFVLLLKRGSKMNGNLTGKTITILATDGFEQVELTGPKKALEQAGANWVDVTVVTDRNLTTSRNLDDISAFNQRIVEQFSGVMQMSRKTA
ncbi:MAG: DJ-1/PfpI family protein [Acidobacteriaceae bacterium]